MSSIADLKRKYSIECDTSLIELLIKKYGICDITPKPPKGVIVPNAGYVELIRSKIAGLKGILKDQVISDMEKALKKEECTDPDDASELMGFLYQKVVFTVYDSFEKVQKTDVAKLEQFLKDVKYLPSNVKSGDSIADYVDYFGTTYNEIIDDPKRSNEIFSIIKHPYEILYWDGGEVNNIVLQGICKFYRYQHSDRH